MTQLLRNDRPQSRKKEKERKQGGENKQIGVLMLIFFILPCLDGGINRKHSGRFLLKSVIADRPDPCALAMFPHNSQLTPTLELPESPVRLYFPPRQKPGNSEAPGPEPSSVI